MFQTRADSSGQGSEKQEICQRERWAAAKWVFASLTGVGMALVKYRCVTLVWYGGLWLPNLLLAPVHSSVTATGLTQTEMRTGGRTWWKKSPLYLIHEVCTSYSCPKPKPQLLTRGKKGGMFPALLGSSVIFLFTCDHQNAV